MNKMAGCKNLMSRLRTFKEINLDFNFFEDDVFTFNMKDSMYLFSTPSHDPYRTVYLNSIANKLFTVCSILLENPYIQY